MSAASKKSKTQQLKECWENGKLDCGAMTPEFIKGLSPRELGMLGELITIDYFNEPATPCWSRVIVAPRARPTWCCSMSSTMSW